jgi:hypothetical protein
MLWSACDSLVSLITGNRNNRKETAALEALLKATLADLDGWDAAVARSKPDGREFILTHPYLPIAVLTAATSDWGVCTKEGKVRASGGRALYVACVGLIGAWAAFTPSDCECDHSAGALPARDSSRRTRAHAPDTGGRRLGRRACGGGR